MESTNDEDIQRKTLNRESINRVNLYISYPRIIGCMSQTGEVTIELNKTDERILEMMGDNKRHDASELSSLLGANRSYLNTRLRYLTNMALVRKIENSNGMYVITESGERRVSAT